MINANELRRGNWVRWDNADIFYQIENINENTGSEEAPILLTSEILEKAGFVFDPSIQQDFSLVLSLKARVSIVYYKGDTLCCSLYQDGNMIDFAAGAVKYVHQLQNLYFALTGEELLIEL